MHRKPRYPTFFRAWREHRGLTLRALAARLTDDEGDPLISYASLGRIERGLQPYSQPVLEAVAEALDVGPGFLISEKPGSDMAEMSRRWFELDHDRRAQASAAIIALLEAMGGPDKPG